MVPGSLWPQMLPHCIRLRWRSSTSGTTVTDIRRAALWKFYRRLNCTASLLRITCTLLAEASELQIAHFLWSFISDMFSRPRRRTPTDPVLPANRRQAFRDAGTRSVCAALPSRRLPALLIRLSVMTIFICKHDDVISLQRKAAGGGRGGRERSRGCRRKHAVIPYLLIYCMLCPADLEKDWQNTCMMQTWLGAGGP